MRHSRRAYEDRTKPTTSFTASMVWRAKFRARPAPSASTASIARISAGLINRARATVTECNGPSKVSSFAWYPVPVVRKGKRRYAWLQSVERKWGTSRYSGTIKWRYRLPKRSRFR